MENRTKSTFELLSCDLLPEWKIVHLITQVLMLLCDSYIGQMFSRLCEATIESIFYLVSSKLHQASVTDKKKNPERNRLQVTSGEIFKRMQKYKDLMTQLSKVNKYGKQFLFIFLMAKIINKCAKKDTTLVLRKQIEHIYETVFFRRKYETKYHRYHVKK